MKYSCYKATPLDSTFNELPKLKTVITNGIMEIYLKVRSRELNNLSIEENSKLFEFAYYFDII